MLATDRAASGASACGLEAPEALVRGLVPGIDASSIVAQHLDPRHASLLPELLERHCPLKVVTVKNNRKLRPSVLYVTPAGRHVSVSAERVQLIRPRPETGPKPSIDRLFGTLAENHEDRAVGVILSDRGEVRRGRRAGSLRRRGKPGLVRFHRPATGSRFELSCRAERATRIAHPG